MTRRARRADPGFFALGRAARRSMLDHLPDDGDDLACYVVLASEATEGELRVGSIADLAVEFRLPVKRLRKRLDRWKHWGWIEMRTAINGETEGAIRFLRDVEHHRNRAPTPDLTVPSPLTSPLTSPLRDREGVSWGNGVHSEQGTVNSEPPFRTVANASVSPTPLRPSDRLRFAFESQGLTLSRGAQIGAARVIEEHHPGDFTDDLAAMIARNVADLIDDGLNLSDALANAVSDWLGIETSEYWDIAREGAM